MKNMLNLNMGNIKKNIFVLYLFHILTFPSFAGDLYVDQKDFDDIHIFSTNHESKNDSKYYTSWIDLEYLFLQA